MLLCVLCAVAAQILLGPQTFSSVAPRLAELGVRLMLTETEAAATAAAAGGQGSHHHTSRHFRGSTSHNFDRRQSVLAKTLSSTAVFWGGGRQNVLSTLAHEDDSMLGKWQGPCLLTGSGFEMLKAAVTMLKAQQLTIWCSLR